MDIQALLEHIDETKAWIDKRRPLAPKEVRELDAYFRVGTTYSSNALEGNTLSLTETKVLLEDGLTVGGRPLRDYNEAIGHAKAYDYMLEIARSEPFRFSEDMTKQLHMLFYQGIEPDSAGIYRSTQVFITGTEYIPPKPDEVPALMAEFVESLTAKGASLHPVCLAAYAHRRLVDIHPFEDGNGRTARLLMNLVLINHGYQIVIIPPILRHEYIAALVTAQRESNPSTESFDCFIAEREIEAQREFCRLFRVEPPMGG